MPIRFPLTKTARLRRQTFGSSRKEKEIIPMRPAAYANSCLSKVLSNSQHLERSISYILHVSHACMRREASIQPTSPRAAPTQRSRAETRSSAPGALTTTFASSPGNESSASSLELDPHSRCAESLELPVGWHRECAGHWPLR